MAQGRKRRRAHGREDDKTQGHFCIYSCPLKGYGPKWHNLISSGCQISILRVRGPKWHLGTSSRTVGVFNSFNYTTYLILFNYVGRRYPAVNIVILTPATFNYAVAHALGRQQMSTAPPQDNSPDYVISIKDMKEWESHWDRAAPHNKLVRA